MQLLQRMYYLGQGLPFNSTIVQREFTHIAYALLFSCRLDMSSDAIFFFCFTLKEYFMFDCFNSQVNNFDDMEREQLFYGHQ